MERREEEVVVDEEMEPDLCLKLDAQEQTDKHESSKIQDPSPNENSDIQEEVFKFH